MANFNLASLTKKGIALLLKAQAYKAVIAFTKAATGDGVYNGDENLTELEELKSIRQEFPISTITIIDDANVYLKFIVSNFHNSVPLEEGYYVKETGIYAMDPDEGEILYAIATAVQDQWDYLPAYNDLLPSTITMEFYAAVANATEVTIKAGAGAYVYQEDYESYKAEIRMELDGIQESTVKNTEFETAKQEIRTELDALQEPVFEDYTGETPLPEPDDAVGMILSGEPITTIHQYTKASLRGILTLAKKALNVAMGKNQARVFASVADLDAWLAVPSNTEKLNVGDNFYIIATDVPDYWWDGTQKQKLETQKVDLTTYDQRITANANAISELNGNMKNNTYLLSGGTLIPANADLNGYKTIGNYYHDANATASTILNCPANKSFTLKVFNSIGTGYPGQSVLEYTTGITFYRRYDDYFKTWTEWITMATKPYVDSNTPKKTLYTNRGTSQEIQLEYSGTYFLILTKNYAGYREDNDLYIVSAPDREGVRGIAQKIYGNRSFTMTVNNNILKIVPVDGDYSSVMLIKLN